MIKRKLNVLVALTTMLTLPVYATGPGFYIGLKAGPAASDASPQQVELKDLSGTVTGKARSNGFSTGLFMGNKLNEYASIEGDVNLMTPIKFDTGGVDTCSSSRSTVTAFDVLGKGSLPFYGFEVFAKAGAGVVYERDSGDLRTGTNGKCGGQVNTIKFRPVVAVGAGYDLNQNWELDATATRLMVGSIPRNIMYYTLGISYHFVDRYCGQFLCED